MVGRRERPAAKRRTVPAKAPTSSAQRAASRRQPSDQSRPTGEVSAGRLPAAGRSGIADTVSAARGPVAGRLSGVELNGGERMGVGRADQSEMPIGERRDHRLTVGDRGQVIHRRAASARGGGGLSGKPACGASTLTPRWRRRRANPRDSVSGSRIQRHHAPRRADAAPKTARGAGRRGFPTARSRRAQNRQVLAAVIFQDR